MLEQKSCADPVEGHDAVIPMDGDGRRARGGNLQRDDCPPSDVRAAGTGIVDLDGQNVVASPEDATDRDNEVIGAVGIAVAG